MPNFARVKAISATVAKRIHSFYLRITVGIKNNLLSREAIKYKCVNCGDETDYRDRRRNESDVVNNALRAKQREAIEASGELVPLEDVAADAVSDVVVAQLGLAASMKDTVVRMLLDFLM